MKQGRDRIAFDAIGYVFLFIISVLCVLPFLLVVSGSLTAERDIQINGFSIIPSKISFDAYVYLLRNPESLFRAYGVTFLLSACGVFLGLLITTMTGYVLQAQEAKFRHQLSFFMYFTTLFSGGLVPFYILMVNVYNMKDTLWAMLLPPLLSVWNIIIVRNYMQSIPRDIYESAKIDGAGHFRMYASITLPLSGPIIATIGLFIGLNYWNEWYHAMLFINDRQLYPLQYFLYRMLNSGRFAEAVSRGAHISIIDLPRESMKMAVIILSTFPIFIFYPFVQKYFVKGLTLGSVKG